MSTANPYLPAPEVQLQHPEWSKDATLYQVNQRQMTPEGTFRAAEKHLQRIRDLGVDILWLMPVQPDRRAEPQGRAGQPLRRPGLLRASTPSSATWTTSGISSPPRTTSACT